MKQKQIKNSGFSESKKGLDYYYPERGIFYLLAIQSVFWLATNILAPFISIFLIQEYTGVGITEYGISNLIYFLSFGLLLPVIGKIEDKTKGLNDELLFLNWGLITRGILFVVMAIANGVWALYIIQLALGFSRALFSPSYKSLLVKLTTKKMGTAYIFSIDESLVNIFAAVGSGISGFLATVLGVRPVILIVGMLFIVATVFSFPLRKYLLRFQSYKPS